MHVEEVQIEIPSITMERLLEGLDRANPKALRNALAQIQAQCDGARSLDNVGFSRLDREIADSIIRWYDSRGYWSPKQEALARRLCRKYRRQLLKIAQSKGY